MEALQLSEHRIRTGYGVSEPAYGTEEDDPLMGLGQGNGIGPCGWTLISSQMIKTMKKLGFAATFRSALAATLITIASFAYVDDCDTPHIAPNVDTKGEEIVDSFQAQLDCWSKLLVATGGELDPRKSNCYLIDFKWTGNKWVYQTMEEMEGEFTLLDKEENRVPLKRLEVSEATETLGVFISMDGNHSAQKEELKKKAKSFAEKLRTRKCEPNTAIYTYNNCFLKSMQYCMPATNFSKEEWASIIFPAKKIAMQKSGMCSTMPSSVIYGSTDYNCFYLEEPYNKQGIEKIATYFQEVSNNSTTGGIIESGALGFRLDIGYNAEIAQLQWKKVKRYVSKCWHYYLADFMHECNLKRAAQQPLRLELKENILKLKLLKENDSFIMEEFVAAGVNDLYMLNIMRLSIKAITLSDICTAESSKITKEAWNLTGSNGLREDLEGWPRNPPKFTKKQKKTWKDALWKVFGKNWFAQDSRYVHSDYRLGKWIEQDPKRKWKSFYSSYHNRLYIKEGSIWKVYRSNNTRSMRSGRYTLDDDFELELPIHANKIATYERLSSQSVYLVCFLRWIYEEPDVPSFDYDPYKDDFINIEYAFEISTAHERVLIDQVKIPKDECKSIAQAIRDKKACIISDGSFFPDKKVGSSAFIITAGKTKKNKLVGTNWVTGLEDEQSPYRSELAGIDGALSMLAVIIKFFNIEEGGFEIALDGQSAMNSAIASVENLKIHQSCYDILQDIRNRLKLMPEGITIKWRHVEGHQKEKGRTNLDFWGIMNDKADSIAKSFLRKCVKQKRKHQAVQLWYEHIAIHINDEKQFNICKKAMYKSLIKDDSFKYWKKHHDFKIPQPESVDWEATKAAINRLPMGLKRFNVKFTSGWIGNRHKLHQWKQIDSPKCLNCNSPVEKSSHVLRCNNPLAKKEFNNKLPEIKKVLKKSNTEPYMEASIMKIIRFWKSGIAITPSTFKNTFGLRDAIKDQQKIGWNNFILGRWSKKWQLVQKRYFAEIGSRKSSLRWTTSIIYKLMMTVWDIWNFRNSLIHGKGGVNQRAKNKDLNEDIRIQLDIGLQNLLKKDQYLRKKYTRSKLLHDSTIVDKQNWIRAVKAARIAVENSENNQGSQHFQQSIIDFLYTDDNNNDS